MSMLQVSDLFHQRGHTFDWTGRVKDQEELMNRMKEFPQLEAYIIELNEFTDGGIASMNFIDHLLEKITKTCAENRIDIT